MDLTELTTEQRMIGLGAMRAIAEVSGGFADEERATIEAIARALELEVAACDVAPASPEAVAAVITDPAWRLRTVQALVFVAMIDGEVTPEEVAAVDRYAEALGVPGRDVKGLHRIVDGQLVRLRIDIARRFPIVRQVAGEMWKEEGVRGILKLISVARGKYQDPEVAWRYKQLGLLPQGTLGREFWEHMTAGRLAFPGEPGGIPEKACHHDITHVLTGYLTDAEGESQIAAFYAGAQKEDPFIFMFGTLLMFQLGYAMSPIATPARMAVDPHKVIAALKRGARCKRDFSDGWDFWPDLPLPVDEVRRKYDLLES